MQGAMEQLTELVEMKGKMHHEIYAEAAQKLLERRREAPRKKQRKTEKKVLAARASTRFSARLATARAGEAKSCSTSRKMEPVKSRISIKSFTPESHSEVAKMVNRWEFYEGD
jgi:hypothetical protein